MDAAYSGQDAAKFQTAVAELNQFYIDSVPTLFVKVRDVYNKLTPHYPWLRAKTGEVKYEVTPQDEELATSVKNALDHAEFLCREADSELVDTTKDHRADTAVICARLLVSFKEKILKRSQVAECFTLATTSLEMLKLVFVNANVNITLLILELEWCSDQEATEKKQAAVKAYKDFRDAKETYLRDYSEFVTCSTAVAEEENLNLPCSFLNHRVYDTTVKIGGKQLSEVIEVQQRTWDAALSKLSGFRGPTPNSVVAPPPTPVVAAAPSPPSRDSIPMVRDEASAAAVWTRKEALLRDLLNRCRSDLETFTEEDCKDMKMRIAKKVAELEDGLTKLAVSPPTSELIRAEEVSRLINTKLEELKTARTLEEENRRANRHEQIRSMAPVPIPKLVGQSNYLEWRVAHSRLNSHTDDYKRGQAVLASIEDRLAKERVQGLQGFSEIMEVISGLYAKHSQLIPAHLNELRRMEPATGNKDALRVIGKIRNVFSRIQSLGEGAVSHITQTVIEDIIPKLPYQMQLQWEEYLEEKDLEAETSGDEKFTVAGQEKDSFEILKDLSPDDISNRSRNLRSYFIKWIKGKERVLNNVQARNRNAGTENTKKTKERESPRDYHKKKQGGAYAAQTKVCPTCDTTTPHKNLKGFVTTSLTACATFRAKPVEVRAKLVRDLKYCSMCIKPNCTPASCPIKGDCLRCKKHKHNRMICQVKVPDEAPKPKEKEVKAESATAVTSGTGEVKFCIGSAKVRTNKGTKLEKLFFDTGANCNFILFEAADRLGLNGTPCTLHLARVGHGHQPISTLQFNVDLIDHKGSKYRIMAYGTERLASATKMSDPELRRLAKSFSVSASSINNVDGRASILIGSGNLSLHPKLVSMRGELGLYKSQFGKPYWVVGRNTKSPTVSLAEACFVDCSKKDFFEKWARADQLGLNTDPKCSTCLKAPACKACQKLETPMSFREQEDGKLIRSKMHMDFENHEVHAEFPFIEDPSEVFHPSKTNRNLVEKMQKNLIKGLKKEDKLKDYTTAFHEQVERGVVRELTQEEIDEWNAAGNPINYIGHHPVEKPSSTSTRIRPVCNSSTPHNGTNLNNLLAKGPCSLSNLVHVLLRFRAEPYLLIGDLKKAYNVIQMRGGKEMHLRRMLWIRPEDVDKENPELKTYVICTAAFGDRSSMFFLEYAKEVIADWSKGQGDEEVALCIMLNTYVDDFVPSLKTREAAVNIRDKVQIAFSQLGFTFKGVHLAGPSEPVDPDREPESLLGYLYNFQEDSIQIKFRVNLSPKKRSARSQPDLTEDEELKGIQFTPSSLLSLQASQYDPVGLASCFLVKGKLLISAVAKKQIGWKAPLDEEDQKATLKYAQELLSLVRDPPVFPRCVHSVGSCLTRLVIFADASSSALHVTMYGIFTSPTGGVETSLLKAKSAICHRSVPANELFALLAANRILSGYIHATDPSTLEDVAILSDSQCSLDQLSPEYLARDVVTRNKLAEIWKSHSRSKIPISYYHLPTNLMGPADAGTRSDCPPSYLRSTEWQQGPEFIKDLENFPEAVLNHKVQPNTEASSISEAHAADVIVTDEDRHPYLSMLDRVSSLEKALKVVCILKTVAKSKSFKSKDGFDSNDMASAMQDLVRVSQAEHPVEELRIKQLLVYKDVDGIVYTKQRCTEETMQHLFETDKLPVLSPKCRLSTLIFRRAHILDILTRGQPAHAGLKLTLTNSRKGPYAAYITHGRHRAKGIVNNCVTCRKANKAPQIALMGPRTGGLGLPAPPSGASFLHIAIDYFGPLSTRTPRGRETRGTKFYKTYGMIVVCQQSRGISLYPVEGYDTVSFMTAFKTHCAMHGVPETILSDPMSAFKAGAKELDIDVNEEDYEYVFRDMNIEWKFIPAASQWKNPAEAGVKSVKAMTRFLTHHKSAPVLTAGEYWLLFRNISEILNRRPLSASVHDDMITFTCVNDLLMGRPSRHVPHGVVQPNDDMDARANLIKDLTSKFWNEMQGILASSPSLFKAQKWYSHGRKPKENDVVLVLYKSKIKDDYRIGVVVKVIDVRTVEIQLSPVQTGKIRRIKPWLKPLSDRPMVVPLQRTVLLFNENDDPELAGIEASPPHPT